MGQVLHGSAAMTAAVRRAIQHSQESLRALARRYGVNPKMIANWKARTSIADRPTGPKAPTSTTLSVEAIVVAFRRHTLLPLDDCLYALQPSLPHLTRSTLHRCLQRHGLSRRPEVNGDKPVRRKFKSHPLGYFHIPCPAGVCLQTPSRPKHFWTNGQVERMNRTIKDATVKRFHYEDYDQPRSHLASFVDAYYYARRLKTLKALMPYEAICRA